MLPSLDALSEVAVISGGLRAYVATLPPSLVDSLSMVLLKDTTHCITRIFR